MSRTTRRPHDHLAAPAGAPAAASRAGAIVNVAGTRLRPGIDVEWCQSDKRRQVKGSMGTVRGTIVDAATGRQVEARVHVLASTGQFRAPPDAILKVGGGLPSFYAGGAFTLDLPLGPAAFTLERGTEYRPLRRTVVVPRNGAVEVEFRLERWIDLPGEGWHAGNTHIHYDEHERRPDDRLRLDPRVEDLSVAVISVLRRRELAYASNKYRVGFAPHFSSDSHAVDVGEETRHNSQPWEQGYGHVMLLGLQHLVEPVSRGILVDDFDPDYPPLVDACDAARRQGGLAIWCHNGKGMEAPVAAALGKLDAFNLFDPYWMDPEWDVWYALLNCGFQLPASTGSDWFVCSSNRVYVHTGSAAEQLAPPHGAPERHAGGAHPLDPGAIHPAPHTAAGAGGAASAANTPGEAARDAHGGESHRVVQAFSYPAWLDGLRAGRTFITNGPALWLNAAGRVPGEQLEITRPTEVPVQVHWRSALPVNRVEVLCNGEVVAREAWTEGRQEGALRAHVAVAPADGHGWLAARCFGDARTSYGHFLWAHTSPVYLRVRPAAGQPAPGPAARLAAQRFVEDLDRSLLWIRTRGKYHHPEQRDRMVRLFQEARERYTAIHAFR
jgi:hypothetical protein